MATKEETEAALDPAIYAEIKESLAWLWTGSSSGCMRASVPYFSEVASIKVTGSVK